MSMSAGAGSPVWFVCWRGRQTWKWEDKMRHVRMFDNITLTGRTRPYKSPKGSALGVRSTLTSREYRCECGHVGWSNHVDLERMTRVTEDMR